MKSILFLQNIVIGMSLVLLGVIPVLSQSVGIDSALRGVLYVISFAAVFVVMMVRPLADITGFPWLRRLVILRKGFGILSSSIIVGFMVDALITPQSPYLASLLSGTFFSLSHLVLFAHVGDLSGLILLLTSNTFSQKLLKQNWKRIQRLSYVYFYAGGIYEAFALDSMFALYAILLVTNLTVLAWAIKIYRRSGITKQNPVMSVA